MNTEDSSEKTLEFISPKSSLLKNKRPSTSSEAFGKRPITRAAKNKVDVLRKKAPIGTTQTQQRPQSVSSLPNILAQAQNPNNLTLSSQASLPKGTTHRRALELATREARRRNEISASKSSSGGSGIRSNSRPRNTISVSAPGGGTTTASPNKDTGGRDPNEPTELENRMALRQEAREAVKRAQQITMNFDYNKPTSHGTEENNSDEDETDVKRAITNLITDHDNQTHAIIRMLDGFDHWHTRTLDETTGLQLVGDPEDHLVGDELLEAIERTKGLASDIIGSNKGREGKLKELYSDTLQVANEEREKQNMQSVKEVLQYKEDISLLQSKVAAATAEQVAMKASISDLETRLSKATIAKSTADVARKKEKEALHVEVKELRHAVTKLEQLNIALEKAFRIKEVASRDKKFLTLMESVAGEVLSAPVVQSNDNDGPSKEEIEVCTKELTEKVVELESRVGAKSEEIERLELDFSDYKNEMEEKIRQIHKGNAAATAGRNTGLREELDGLREELRQSNSVLEQYQSEKKSMENAQSELENKLNLTMQQNEELHTSLKQEMDQKANILESLQSDITNAESAAMAETEKVKQNARVQKEQMESEMAELEKRLAKTNEDRISRMREKHEAEVIELKAREREVSSEKAKLQYQLEHLDAGHDHANAKVEHIEAELKNAARTANQAEERANSLEAQLEKVKGLAAHAPVMKHFTEMAVAVVERAASWIVGLTDDYPDIEIVGSNETLLVELLHITAETFPKVMDPEQSVDGIEKVVEDITEKLKNNKASKAHRAMVDARKAAASKESEARIRLGQKEAEHLKLEKLLTEKYHHLLLAIEHAAPREMTERLHELVQQAENKLDPKEYEHLHRQAISLIPKEGGGPKAIELKERLEKAMIELTQARSDLRDVKWEKDELLLERDDLEKKIEKLGKDLGMSKASVSALKQSNKEHKSRAQAEKEAREKGLMEAQHMEIVDLNSNVSLSSKDAKGVTIDTEPGTVSLQDQLEMANNSLTRCTGELRLAKSEFMILRGDITKFKESSTSFTSLLAYIEEVAGDNEHRLVEVADQLLPLLKQLKEQLAASEDGQKLMEHVNPVEESHPEQPLDSNFGIENESQRFTDLEEQKAKSESRLEPASQTESISQLEPKIKVERAVDKHRLFSREQWDHYQKLLEKEKREKLRPPKEEVSWKQLALEHSNHKAAGDSLSLQIELMRLQSEQRKSNGGDEISRQPRLEEISREYLVSYDNDSKSLQNEKNWTDTIELNDIKQSLQFANQKEIIERQQHADLEELKLEHQKELEEQIRLRDEAVAAFENESDPSKKAEYSKQLEIMNQKLEKTQELHQEKEKEQLRQSETKISVHEHQVELILQQHALQEEQKLHVEEAMQLKNELEEKQKKRDLILERLESTENAEERAEIQKELVEANEEFEMKNVAHKAHNELGLEQLRRRAQAIDQRTQEMNSVGNGIAIARLQPEMNSAAVLFDSKAIGQSMKPMFGKDQNLLEENMKLRERLRDLEFKVKNNQTADISRVIESNFGIKKKTMPTVKCASEALAVLGAMPKSARIAIPETGENTKHNEVSVVSNTSVVNNEIDNIDKRDRRETVQAQLAMLEEVAKYDPSEAEKLKQTQEELAKELEAVEIALVNEALNKFDEAILDAAGQSEKADSRELQKQSQTAPFEIIDQYPVDLQSKILRTLLDQAENEISSKRAELKNQKADHDTALAAAKTNADIEINKAIALQEIEWKERVRKVQDECDSKIEEIKTHKKNLELAQEKYAELESSIDAQVQKATKEKIHEVKMEKRELEAALSYETEQRNKFRDLYEALQSTSDHEIEKLKERLEKTNGRYSELKAWKEKAVAEGLLDAVVELNHERFGYAAVHEDLIKTIDRLLKLIPSEKDKTFQEEFGGVMLSDDKKKAVHQYRAKGEETRAEVAIIFERYRNVSHAPLPKDDEIKSLMKSDTSMMTILSQAVVEYFTNLRCHMESDLTERKREVDALTRHCIGMKAETDELAVAYDSEDTAEVIRKLRNIVKEQNLAIQYHVMMFEKTALEGTLMSPVLENQEVGLLKNALATNQMGMSPPKPLADSSDDANVGTSEGVLETLEKFVNDGEVLKKIALRIEDDAQTGKEDVVTIRREATSLERERVTEITHELFRRVDDMFVRIDGLVRRIFLDTNYRSLLEWGRSVERKQDNEKLGKKSAISLNYFSPGKSQNKKLKAIQRRGLPKLGMESAKQNVDGVALMMPQPVKAISKSASKSAARLHNMTKPGHLEKRDKQMEQVRKFQEPTINQPVFELDSDPAQCNIFHGPPKSLGSKMLPPRHGVSKRLERSALLANKHSNRRARNTAQRSYAGARPRTVAGPSSSSLSPKGHWGS